MRKFYVALCFFILSQISNAQEKISITPTEITSLVVNVEGKSAESLYKSALEWVNKFYKNPEYVIKSKIENSYLRVEGIDNFTDGKQLTGSKLHYTLELDFKEGRYKISFINVTYKNGMQIPKTLYNSKGELRHYDFYKHTHSEAEKVLNSLNDEVYNYVSGKTNEKSDW